MNKSIARLRTASAAAAVALVTAIAAPAAVAGPFKVNPASNGLGGTGTFTADFVNGNSTALIQSLGGNQYSSNGYIQYSGFVSNGSLLSAGVTGLNVTYGLYATFSQTFTCAGPLNVGTTCSVSTINLNLYADRGNNDTFTNASVSPSKAPTVTDNGNNDIKLGSANVVVSGTAGINALGGAFENVNTNFALTAAGSNFFIDPIPFYNFAFSNFNNSSGGVTCNPANCVNPQTLAINAENGGSIFANPVPEPGSIALVAIGFFSLAAISRRKSKAL